MMGARIQSPHGVSAGETAYHGRHTLLLEGEPLRVLPDRDQKSLRSTNKVRLPNVAGPTKYTESLDPAPRDSLRPKVGPGNMNA